MISKGPGWLPTETIEADLGTYSGTRSEIAENQTKCLSDRELVL